MFQWEFIQQIKCKSCPIHDQCTKSRVKEIFEPNKPLRLKLHQFYQSEKGQYYYKKRANLDEGYFGTMRKSRNFQRLERKGLKNGEKELTLRATSKIGRASCRERV